MSELLKLNRSCHEGSESEGLGFNVCVVPSLIILSLISEWRSEWFRGYEWETKSIFELANYLQKYRVYIHVGALYLKRTI